MGSSAIELAVTVEDRMQFESIPRSQSLPAALSRRAQLILRLVDGVIENIFGFRKTRYRELAKNLHRLEVTTALANLYIVRRRLLKA